MKDNKRKKNDIDMKMIDIKMKYVREFLNEKFTDEDSDPIKDMGIGLIHKLKEEYLKNYSRGWNKIDINHISLEQLLTMCLSLNTYNLDTIECLIDAGAKINEKGTQFLSHSVWRGIDYVKLFLEKAKFSKGQLSQAFDNAARRNKLDIAELLLEKGANINVGGGSPLRTAVRMNNTALAKWLLERGANPNSYGYRCLLMAIKYKNYELADFFAKEYLKDRKKI